MIYIVTGFMRSGTSMMMLALEAGGIPVAKNESRDNFMRQRGRTDKNYKMNKNLQELEPRELKAPDFRTRYEGHAVKVVFPFLRLLKPHMYEVEPKLFRPGYKIVMMVRHPEEIRQSAIAARLMPDGTDSKRWERVYGAYVRGHLQSFQERPDIDTVTLVNYRRVLDDPVAVFARLLLDGWPIDTCKAPNVVDSKQHRFRLERLTVGI